MEVEQEELVQLIFGEEGEPDNWRENPEFLQYLTELGAMGGERLRSEPERVAEDLKTVQAQTQELAFANYKTFIRTSDCSRDIFTEFSKTEEHLEHLVHQLPGFMEKCEEFQTTAKQISTHRRLTSLTLSKHNSLLEILELPQLMDTVVRNHHYDEALELHAYVTKLARKQPEIRILEDIARAVTNSIKLMLHQLLAQLRAPIQLPQCLKVISYLRRMDIFTETELRLKFLQARETWLQSVTNTVPRDDPYVHLTRTMEVMRVHLFDIVTQYRAIFSDHTEVILGPGGGGEAPQDGAGNTGADNRLLFTSWLSKKIQEFLGILARDLETETGSLESLLGQAMYFGLSFSRVGCDFRPLLVPIFQTAVKKQFLQRVSLDANSKLFSDSLASLNLQRLATITPVPYNQSAAGEMTQPPLCLMDFPPLAHICNSVLSGLNEIRLCAPIALAPFVTQSTSTLLVGCVNLLSNYHTLHSQAWGDRQKIGFQQLCLALARVLVPYLQRCISAVFLPQEITEITGISAPELQENSIGFLPQTSICQPLTGLLPAEAAEPTPVDLQGNTEEVVEPIPPARTEYVADKMAELASEVDSTNNNHTSTTDSTPDISDDIPAHPTTEYQVIIDSSSPGTSAEAAAALQDNTGNPSSLGKSSEAVVPTDTVEPTMAADNDVPSENTEPEGARLPTQDEPSTDNAAVPVDESAEDYSGGADSAAVESGEMEEKELSN